MYALKAFVELFESGDTDGLTSPPNWDDNAIAAFIDNSCIGILTWTKSEWAKAINVRLGHINQKFRRKGIYQKLWKELLIIAREEKVNTIIGATGIKNMPMQAVMKSQKRKETAICYSFTVEYA